MDKKDPNTGPNIAGHVLPVSATMVGVCMTVISVVQLAPKGSISRWVDQVLAIDSFLFLVSAAFSYFSIRIARNSERNERVADNIFMLALMLMVFAGFVVSFELFVE